MRVDPIGLYLDTRQLDIKGNFPIIGGGGGGGSAPAIGAAIRGAVGALIAELFASSDGGSGDPPSCDNGDDDGDKCEKQALRDEQMCRMATLPKTGPRARCWESVSERYGACRSGRPLPPLVMW